jgi:tripeptide aminopeptidase
MRGLVDERRAIGHLLDLIRAEGPSGGEGPVSDVVRSKAIAAGCRAAWIRRDDAHRRIGDGFRTGNLIVRVPGRRGTRRRLFSGHLDTVPLCRGAVPQRRGQRIVARGATGLGADNRTAVACMVTVLETILRRSLEHPPLTFLFTVGEEVGLRGATAVRVSALGRPAYGFNIDGGAPARIAIGALGAERWEVDVLGRSAHAGTHPEQGVSATLIAARAIETIARRGFFGAIRKGRHTGSSNVGIIRGGEATNQVTDHVFVRGESRSHDGRFVRQITGEIERAFVGAARSVVDDRGRSGRIRFRSRVDYRPFRIPREAEVVRLASEAVRSIGLDPDPVVVDGGLDANPLNAKGIPTVTLGAGQHRAHTLDEYVSIREYLDGCRLALALATT